MVKKVSLILLGIVVGLIVCEVSLRIAGYLYYNFWMKEEHKRITRAESDLAKIENNQKISPEDKTLFKILCLGDSWTFGAGASAGYSYPAQLQVLLDKEHPYKYRVYNFGIPGCYSRKLLRYLPGLLKKYEPNIVIILIGTNDAHNYPPSDLVYVSTWPRRFYFSLTSEISDLRLYKLIRLGLDGLMQKTGALKRHAACTNEKMRDESNRWVVIGHNLYTAGKFELGEAYLKKAINIDPGNEEAYMRLGHLYQAIRQYAKSLTCYDQVIGINPYTVFRTDLYNFLFLMYQEANSRRDIRDKIIYLVRKIPSDDMFKNPGIPFILNRKLTMRNLENNLIKIIDLIKSNKATPIMQTYYANPHFNDFLINFSKKHGILLVDNAKNLEGVADIKSYFAPDNHPNEKGYFLIAQSVLGVLMKIDKQ